MRPPGASGGWTFAEDVGAGRLQVGQRGAGAVERRDACVMVLAFDVASVVSMP